MKTFALIGVAALLGGCSMISDPATDAGRPLLEVEYVNYAWGKVYNGFFINDGGQIFKYDRKGETWSKANDSSGNLSDLADKYQPERTLQQTATLDAATIAAQIN